MNEKKLLENIFEVVAGTAWKDEAKKELETANIELYYDNDYIDFTSENGDIYRVTIQKTFVKDPE